MIKNFLLISILCFLVFSCGKKGDPKYVGKKESINTNIVLINKV